MDHNLDFFYSFGYGIVFDYNGIDGLSKNLPSRIASTQKNRYGPG